MLIGNNKDKLITPTGTMSTSNNKGPCIFIKDDIIKIQFNKNIVIVMKLIINSNVITNNLPMLYSITINNDYCNL
jgi:hypothetical protein